MKNKAQLLADLKAAAEKQNRIREMQKKALEKAEGNAELKAQIAAMNDDMNALDEKMAAMQVELQRPDPAGEAEEKTVKAAVREANLKSAFFKLMTKSGRGLTTDEKEALADHEQKSMLASNDTEGGYLVPPQVESEILKNVVEYSPIREVATVMTINGPVLTQPRKTSGTTASWTAESGLPDETKVKFGLKMFHVHSIGALSQPSLENLEDAANLEPELIADQSEQHAVTEGTAFISGNGVNKPEGVLHNVGETGYVESLTTASSGTIDFTDLIKITGKLKEPYHARAIWLMNRESVAYFRTLKNSNGDYIWEPAIPNARPAAIAGYPYRMATDLTAPSASNTYTGSSYPVLFGDFKQGYLIVDRRGMRMQKLVEKYAPLVGYWGTRRVGGGLRKPEAIKAIKVKA